MTKTKKKFPDIAPCFDTSVKEFSEQIQRLNQEILTLKILELFDQAYKYKKLKPIIDEIDGMNEQINKYESNSFIRRKIDFKR